MPDCLTVGIFHFYRPGFVFARAQLITERFNLHVELFLGVWNTHRYGTIPHHILLHGQEVYMHTTLVGLHYRQFYGLDVSVQFYHAPFYGVALSRYDIEHLHIFVA